MEHLDQIFEALGPEQDQKVVIAVGRFSVPTIAHYHIINKMKEFARKNKQLNLSLTPVVMVVAGKDSSKDKLHNPLSAEDRIKFMKASGFAEGVKFLIAPDAFTAFAIARDKGFEPLVVAAGSDRVDTYLDILNKNFKSKDGKAIKHLKVSDLFRDENGEFSKVDLKRMIGDVKEDQTIELSKVSSSLARLAVQMDEPEVFNILTGLTKKAELASLLFNKVKKAMEIGKEGDK